MTPKEVRKLWVEALRSGKYKQGKYSLHKNNGEFCCLGVLCDLAIQHGIVSGWEETKLIYGPETSDTSDTLLNMGIRCKRGNLYTQKLPIDVSIWVGMNSFSGVMYDKYDGNNSLTSLNDKQDPLTFDKIADLIEAEPTGLFKHE